MLLGALVSYALGRDLNWDFYNYHLYSPLAYWTQDLRSEFMGAGIQRYLNPIGYLPFYWMVSAGWHSAAIGMVLGAFHALSIFFLWRICNEHVFRDERRRRDWVALAVAFGSTSAVFLSALGTSFLDPTVAVFVMAAAYLLIADRGDLTRRALRLVGAGFLLGVATGLKPTSAIFGVAALVAYCFAVPPSWERARSSVLVGAGLVGGIVVAHGGWSLELYREFGNPIFPLANDIFRSPDFPAISFDHARFRPVSLLDALLLPFQMAKFHSWIYVEPISPDIRFAGLCIACAVWGASRASVGLLRLKRASASAPSSVYEPNTSLRFAVIFSGASFILWQLTSGNGRYALPLLVFVGPLLVAAVRAATGDRDKAAFIVLLAALVVQAFLVASAGNPRWSPAPWSRDWLEIEVDEGLKREPFGIVSTSLNSYSAIAFALHPQSRFVSLVGVHPIDPHGPGSARVRAFLATHVGRTRAIVGVPRKMREEGNFAPAINRIDRMIAGWDLRIDASDCLRMKIPNYDTAEEWTLLLACRLVEGSPLREQQDLERRKIALAFDQVEKACPQLFRPGGGYVTFTDGRWVREFPATDIRLFASAGRIRFSRFDYGPFDFDLGAIDDWRQGRAVLPIECRPLPKPF